MYLDLLENTINPALTDIIEQDDRYHVKNLIFQQDGASPLYAMPARQFLNETFQEWIGRRATTEWLSRLPDLSSLNFFL